jgi:hypothetical protein
MPDPILVGRNRGQAQALRRACTVGALDDRPGPALADPQRTEVYFDAQTTAMRAAEASARRSPRASMSTARKPTAVIHGSTAAGALPRWPRRPDQARRGAGQALAAGPASSSAWSIQGFFGRILSVRGEFGYWVFEGDTQPAQRPSWNYRKEDGGGIIVDMLCHWRYVLDNLSEA